MPISDEGVVWDYLVEKDKEIIVIYRSILEKEVLIYLDEVSTMTGHVPGVILKASEERLLKELAKKLYK